ncbi:MAG TPA: hypothetical protein VGP32_00060 [Steroidobacteraceae bacterium]|jgi:hypothetical protein|nr:hypothetical protein [Steroidobacteraceae bacterium]
MPPETRTARASTLRRGSGRTAPPGSTAILLLALGGCVGGLPGQRPPPPAPVVSPAATASALLTDYLQLLQRLAQGPPAEQAEILTSAQHDYDIAPTPSHQLKLALVLGTPGHPGTNLPKAQGMLRVLMANPEMLLPGERSLAFLMLSQIDDHLTLETENRRLQADAVKADRERVAGANHRLQAEMDENARLRKELEEARAKLEAIANIERSLNARKPEGSGHQP